MIPYILYASLILAACLVFYKLLLQKETFFHLNRFILLSCMVMAFILPVLRVPQQMSFRKAPSAVNTTGVAVQDITQSIENKVNSTVEPVQQNKTINIEQVIQWLIYLYWFGVAIFAFNFLMQVVVLLHKAYSRPVIIDGRFRIVEISGDKAPCSFGNNIFINPEKYDWETYNQVLLHEKIHIEQKHTLDLLLAEIVLVFLWFNPFAWMWRKELESNLEFFTDSQLLQNYTVEKESYQMSLVKVAAPHYPLSITTNYNQSLLKKRLVMMNAKKSNVHTIWKYFFLLPLMVLFVCLFNEPIANAQNNSTARAKPKPQTQHNNEMKTSGNWFATIKEGKINFQFKDEEKDNSYNGNSFLVSEFSNLPRDKQGTFTLVREAGTMEFTGKFEGDKGMGQYKFVANKSYGSDMQKEGINLADDKDLMVFFLVNVKQSYVQMLKKQGYTKLDKDNIIPLAALDVNETYITSIKQAGFPNIDLDNLVPFRALNIDKAYIEEIRNAGYKNLTPDKVITFKAQGIDGKYIADYRSSVNISKEDKDNENKDANDNSEKNKEANDDKNEDDIIAFKSMNIDKAFINSFKEVGYTDLSNNDLIAMKSLGVTPEYIKTFRNAGYTNLKADDLIALKAQGITPEYIKTFRNAGYTDLKADDLVALKAQGVTPALIKQYKDLGFKDVSLDDIIGAKATGTSPAFISSMKQKGHNMKSLDKYIALKSVISDN